MSFQPLELGWFGGGDRSEPSTLEISLPATASVSVDTVSAGVDVAGVRSTDGAGQQAYADEEAHATLAALAESLATASTEQRGIAAVLRAELSHRRGDHRDETQALQEAARLAKASGVRSLILQAALQGAHHAPLAVMTDASTALISPQARDALATWLSHLKSLDGAAANTVTAYGRDVAGYLSFLARHRGQTEGTAALASLPTSDLRAWMAHERGRGVSARSLARALSAVKGFTAWAADRTGADATTVLAARGPKFRRKLPRPLTEEAEISAP